MTKIIDETKLEKRVVTTMVLSYENLTTGKELSMDCIKEETFRRELYRKEGILLEESLIGRLIVLTETIDPNYVLEGTNDRGEVIRITAKLRKDEHWVPILEFRGGVTEGIDIEILMG